MFEIAPAFRDSSLLLSHLEIQNPDWKSRAAWTALCSPARSNLVMARIIKIRENLAQVKVLLRQPALGTEVRMKLFFAEARLKLLLLTLETRAQLRAT